jgi:glycosyltransferase involved in cell wall biosynthesis
MSVASVAGRMKNQLETLASPAPAVSSNLRIATVEYGDYAEALRLVRTVGQEPYAGMRHSVEALQDLFGDHPHLVISLNAPARREIVGNGLLVGVPSPAPRLWRRGRINKLSWARRVCKELKDFQPTHLLMRAAGHMALAVLRLSTKREWPTLALFANNFGSADRAGRNVEQQLVKYLNHPSVTWVGNHRQISAQGLIDLGVDPAKVVAYDWPAARHPSQYQPKQLDRSKPIHLLYAANMIEAKGIGDLIEAVGLLKRQGMAVRLTAFGVGPDLERMREMSRRIAPDDIEFPGRVENDVLFEHMRKCTLMCVVTRPSFQEGGSLVLTEALASRSPTVLSDQVMFKRSFQDGQGVRFFHAGDPTSLAMTIREAVSNESTYASLSEGTAPAFARVECKLMFGDVVRRWKATFHTAVANSTTSAAVSMG